MSGIQNVQYYDLPPIINSPAGIKEDARRVAMEERRILEYVLNNILRLLTAEELEVSIPNVENPSILDVLFTFLENISSTAIALAVMYSYGFVDNQFHTNEETAEYLSDRFPMCSLDQRAIATMKKTLMMTILLKFGERISFSWTILKYYFPDEIEEETSGNLIDEQETQIDASSLAKQKYNGKIRKRAQGNLSYYEDRLMLLEHDEKILALLLAIRGQGVQDYFAQYYRLGRYRKSSKFYDLEDDLVREKGGVTPELEKNIAWFPRSLNDGRAVAEYVIYGENSLQQIEWTDGRGDKRKRVLMPTSIDHIIDEVKLKDQLQNLNLERIWQREDLNSAEKLLVNFAVPLILQGQQYTQVIRMFLAEYYYLGFEENSITHNTLGTVLQKCTQFNDPSSVEYRLVDFSRVIESRMSLLNIELRSSLLRTLRSMLEDYHIRDTEGNLLVMKELEERYGLASTHMRELRAMLDRFMGIFKNSEGIPVKGSLTLTEINESFAIDSRNNQSAKGYIESIIKLSTQLISDKETWTPMSSTEIAQSLLSDEAYFSQGGSPDVEKLALAITSLFKIHSEIVCRTMTKSSIGDALLVIKENYDNAVAES